MRGGVGKTASDTGHTKGNTRDTESKKPGRCLSSATHASAGGKDLQPTNGAFQQQPTRHPAIYHCVNRVVDRRFVFGEREKDRFVELMRMYEVFTGIRVLAYCVMSNHFHLMLEITPMPDGGLSDADLLNRLAAIHDDAVVDAVEIEIENARIAIAEGRANENRIDEIHLRYTYRMHDLSEFMKSLVQRFTQWYNRSHNRRGNLWEDAFRSTVVAPGTATRLVAAYIDLNPVRAGLVEDPANYPWCSYGEASAADRGKKPDPASLIARAGLVRAFFIHQQTATTTKSWKDCHGIYRPWIEQAMTKARAMRSGKPIPAAYSATTGGALLSRIRHFTDGVAIGDRGFLEDFFKSQRPRFGTKRTTGARPIRGYAAGLAQKESLWSLRDLQRNIGPEQAT